MPLTSGRLAAVRSMSVVVMERGSGLGVTTKIMRADKCAHGHVQSPLQQSRLSSGTDAAWSGHIPVAADATGSCDIVE